MKRYLGTLLAVLLCSAVAIACNVPVFRYALERWPADLYEVVVLHDGPLGQEDQDRLELLKQSERESVGGANFKARAIDMRSTQDQQLIALWKEHAAEGQPMVAVFYPRNAREVPDRLVGTSRFNDNTIRALVDSPVRQAVAKNLLKGDSAVWIFVPSGHADQDQVALKTLKEQIKLNEEALELPPQDEIEADEFFLAENPIELRIGFSIVTLKRDDPKEQQLLQLLLASEPDLESLSEPMAFPVIGRGRVLYALVGKGIFRDTIAMASSFVVGPCSCQVKDQNPGFDLLMAVDWDAKLGGATISEPAQPGSSKPVLIAIPPGKK